MTMRMNDMKFGTLVGVVALVTLALGACSDDDTPKRDAAVGDRGPDVTEIDGKVTPDLPAVDQRLADQGLDQAQDQAGSDVLEKDQGAVDLRPDIVLTGDALTTPKCALVGGGCTSVRWEICPAGTQPAATDPHQDCGGGWCCVASPPSTCSQSDAATCVEGSKCSGCWGPAASTSLTCPAGRVCCMDICDG